MLVWGMRSTTQRALGTRARAVFWDFQGRGCMQKRCVHATLGPGATVQICSEGAWVQICATPLPARGCICVFPIVQSPIAAAERCVRRPRYGAVRCAPCVWCHADYIMHLPCRAIVSDPMMQGLHVFPEMSLAWWPPFTASF